MITTATDFFNYEPLPRKTKKLNLTAVNRVLVAEDDLALASLLTSVLQEISPNIIVDWATSGEEAEYYLDKESEYFADSPYDLIIADIFLEGQLTGLDLWRTVDQKYPNSNILVTSSLSVEKFVSCLKYEFACPPYLPKPFSMAECKEAIQEFL